MTKLNLFLAAIVQSLALFWYGHTTIIDVPPRIDGGKEGLGESIVGLFNAPEMHMRILNEPQLKLGHDMQVGQPEDLIAKNTRSSALVLASVPWDERHLVAAWSQLECLSQHVNLVVIAAPRWGRPIVHRLIDQVKREIPHFAGQRHVSIAATFSVNDRYDVGLWCDALEEEGLQEQFDDVILLNDSIFAIREFNGVLETLQRNNLSMTSLNHAHNEDGTWLESVYRAFSRTGLRQFMNHSCVPKDHPSFCRNAKNGRKKKRCITTHHEVGMARQFPSKQVAGLFQSEVPEYMRKRNDFPTWVLHVPYWRQVLVKQMNFPAAKVNVEEMIPSTGDPMLQNCTQFLDGSWLQGFDFSVARRTINY
jgi:hypothetical protein